ncbi:MAG: efflux RND transporter periplasmic adaptor subunit [Pseudomonadota bacterium]
MAALAAVLISPHNSADAQGRAASVLVEDVELRAIADTSPVLGQLVASVQADVAARRGGVAENVLFEIGDIVSTGDPLVQLETRIAEIELRTAEAELAVAQAGILAAEASVALAEQVLARQERLKGSTAFQQGIFDDRVQEVAQARGRLTVAAASVGAAEARMARVEYDLENAMILAPFTGIVVERMAQPGQYVNLGEPVAKLLDVQRLEIEADVPVELVQGLSPGTEVTVRVGDGNQATAQVRVVLPVETISTRTRPVRFSLDTSAIDPLLVAVGASLILEIPTSAPREVVTVPKDALVQGRGGGWMVFVVVEDAAEPRPIQIGQAAGDRMEVLNGVAPGDQVVVRGNERLRPGQPVNASPAGG